MRSKKKLDSLSNVAFSRCSTCVCACTSRSHELSNTDTIADWETDFKWSAAAAVLKRVILEGGFKSVEPETAEVALEVCKARLSHIRDMIEAGVGCRAQTSRDR